MKPNLKGYFNLYFLEILYSILMVYLVFQMTAGLIVDTFISIRKEQEDISKDLKNICFICGSEREEIEIYYTGKEGFKKHQVDHNLFSYFCFVFYLRDKNESEYSGIETYVKGTLLKDSISWLPINRFLKKENKKLINEGEKIE